MAKQILVQKGSEHPYFHKDFHILLNEAIAYLDHTYGAQAVRAYLTRFAAAWYKPLKDSIQKKGLDAVQAHYERIYQLEGARFKLHRTRDSLTLQLEASPAVLHIRASGHPVSEQFFETVATVNRVICQGTSLACELLTYSEENGGYRLRFFGRMP